jgi:hypothetical protein
MVAIAMEIHDWRFTTGNSLNIVDLIPYGSDSIVSHKPWPQGSSVDTKPSAKTRRTDQLPLSGPQWMIFFPSDSHG